ncbi:hypothetical protein [Variovorax guangxiensis]|uniref:N-linked glycosylation glycosyltransferase PglG n=1 Tax=Variovorax guangxiensis TaxID=1775474 RepID=A0A502DZG0_9BURK|nr:hypothetical protein [Variovorax guangxiensis]RZI65042.1 MAG: hypothetical protein EOP79_12860 [Variovorax sp.]TPG26324.1 hypothetical protein EAH83_00640 [Variovorax ginsengisoli]TPG30049.1 hypothetical protein EAH82_00640 [Variovorax guangxiensis]
MKTFLRIYAAIHAVMALLFAAASLALMVIAARNGWLAIIGGMDTSAAEAMIEAIGLLAAAVVALQISQTITEQEVIRDTHIGSPTRVRRFLSRFMVVIVVAVAVEALVATFKARETPELMLHAAALFCAVGVVLIGWGVFVHLNRSAEELEPEAMADAKSEDRKLE